ncbi:MAG: hypothetical protein ABW118_10385 [Candidatus Thiodiazotropha sp.]
MDNITTPEVFIIESLSFKDEIEKNYEGKIISNILHLSNKKSIYYYIRTKHELEEVLDIFWETKYRYLHISCHGNNKEMATTIDTIPFNELAEIVEPFLENRRLFISACSMTNEGLAKTIIPSSECLSIIGPAKDINFNDAAILWASFYHLMFRDNFKKMNRELLLKNTKSVAQMYKVPMNYYSKTKTKKGYKYTRINTAQRKIKIKTTSQSRNRTS